jgi:hypothetical protein
MPSSTAPFDGGLAILKALARGDKRFHIIAL